mmetsp:Transcript_1170/g.2163  ORF Transcript_1170/g.2163 Transcript_1170/m.2163 type:complete len:448 (+) Transcript_1170:542-1885(+)
MSPHRRKDVVQLNVNRREGQESRNDHLEEPTAVPGHLRGNLARHLGRASRRIKVMARIVFGGDPPQHGQRKRDQRVERGNGKDGREGQRAGGSMGQGDGVHPHEDNGHGDGEEASREEDAADPGLAVHLEVEAGGHEAADGACEAVEDDECGEDGSAAGGGDEVGQRQSEEEEGGHDELHSRSDRGAEEDGELWEAEHVAVDQLPTRLLLLQRFIIQLHIPRKVILQHPHQDNRQERRQQQHQHERINNTQPVNLKASRQKPRIGISRHAHLPRQLRILEPFHRVRELHRRGLVHVGNVHTTIPLGRDGDADNLVFVRAHLKMQMGKQIRVTPLHLPQNGILILKVPNISPHGQILNKHLKEIIIMNRLLKFGQFFRPKGGFAQKSPFDIIMKTELVGRGFATVPRDAFAEAHLVLFGADAIGLDAALGGGHELVVRALGAHGHVFF